MMNDDLRTFCERECANVLANRGWQLATRRAEFVAQVVADVQGLQAAATYPVALDKVVRLAISRCYNVVLCEACTQNGSARQHRAFEEIWNHLYPIARAKLREPSRTEECTQNAIASVWEKLEQCRDPRLLLAWAQVILLNHMREMLRGQLSEMDMQTGPLDADDEDAPDGLNDVPEPSQPAPRLEDTTRARLEAAIRQCLRSRNQQRVIIELFLSERSLKETADLLGLTVGNVSVLRTRALELLRKCDDFIHALEDWLDSRP